MDLNQIIYVTTIISGFSITTLMFRIQREITMAEKKKSTWIPPADFMLIAAILIAVFFALVPALLSNPLPNQHVGGLSSAFAIAAIALVGGYILAILAHYRWLFWLNENTENDDYTNKWELIVVVVTVGYSGYLFFCFQP